MLELASLFLGKKPKRETNEDSMKILSLPKHGVIPKRQDSPGIWRSFLIPKDDM